MYPRISIVTPSFNQGAYLEQTILSVLNQKYPNLEYIIIDGGSTDNSLEIIKKYEHSLAYWVSEKDDGMYDAISKGFKRATGDVMAWINSDDLYHPGAFSTVSEIFNNFPEVSWLQGNPSFLDEEGKTVGVGPLRYWSKFNIYLFDFKWIQQESCFWRKTLWDKAGSGFNSSLTYAGDFELWLRFFRHEKLFVTDALIGGFRQRKSNQLSLDHLEDYITEASECIQAEILDPDVQNQLREINYYKKLQKITRRFNLGFLRMKYYNLFGYPAKVQFNRKTQRYELIEIIDTRLYKEWF
jgi:glycosyltransferase involved in cell wall biosynthesis